MLHIESIKKKNPLFPSRGLTSLKPRYPKQWKWGEETSALEEEMKIANASREEMRISLVRLQNETAALHDLKESKSLVFRVKGNYSKAEINRIEVTLDRATLHVLREVLKNVAAEDPSFADALAFSKSPQRLTEKQVNSVLSSLETVTQQLNAHARGQLAKDLERLATEKGTSKAETPISVVYNATKDTPEVEIKMGKAGLKFEFLPVISHNLCVSKSGYRL